MIKHKDIRKFQARYHRNGVCGAGFWLCRFLLVEGRDFKEMQAVVFEENGHIAVTSTGIEDKYRGDHFKDVLREAIEMAAGNANVPA